MLSASDSKQTDSTDIKQLFILGAPRSGTTFLASLLRSSQYGAPIESQFVVKYFTVLNNYGDLNQFSNFNRLLGDITRERAVMQWQLELDAAQLHQKLVDSAGQVNYSDLIDELFLARSEAAGRRAWGDKTPHYLGEVEVLNTLFPAARYLYIVRDGRDVALSLLQKDWGPNNLFTAAEYWVRLNKVNPTLTQLIDSGKVYFLRYEDLATDVEQHVRDIAAFLGEDISESEIERLATTVRKDNSYKWKQALSDRKIQLFDSVAHETLVRFGYEVAQQQPSRVSTVQRIIYQIHDRISWLGFMFKTNVIHGFQIRFLGKEPFAD